MKCLTIYIIFISLTNMSISKSLEDSHGLHGKSKRIGRKSNSHGIDVDGNISRRYCDRNTGNLCWEESSEEGECMSHRCTRENRLERRDLLRRGVRRNRTDVRTHRAILGRISTKKVTGRPEGVAAPTFEDDGDESKAHTNEVPNFSENQEVAHVEVNENDKGMKVTGTLASPFIYRRTFGVSEDEKLERDGEEMAHPSRENGKKMLRILHMDDPPEFIDKLESVFSLFGDYIIAIMLKNLKLRLRQGNIAEVYQKRIEEEARENEGNTIEAAKTIEERIREAFGESFQVKIDRYLKSLVEHIVLPQR